MERAHGKWAALQRDSSCPGAAPLQSPAGLRALPEGSKGRGARQREVKGSLGWEDDERSLTEKVSQSVTW